MNRTYPRIDLHKNRSYITVVDGDGQILGEENLKSKGKSCIVSGFMAGKPDFRNLYFPSR